MIIKGKFVTLRAIEPEDLELMRALFNEPEIEDKVVGWSFPLSKYQEQKWYENHYSDSTNQRFIIETEDDGAVGMIALVNIDWKNRTATQGIKLLKKEIRSKGIGTDSMMALMRYAFDELQLHRLEGSWFTENIASRNLHLKLGWTVEGIKREKVYKHGKYRDIEIAGMLKNEYYEIANKLNYWGEEK